ncbi:MAG: exonuclease SbcCD subunit D [Peptococcaceae bacterium]|nr:exonuclease SbcCD subunit D [Peptococcaceae bacterium]
MKLMHIADLHIGKRVNEFSMLEDQKFILNEILRLVDEVRPSAILMAGDIYDKSVPAGEAVEVLDEFLTELVAREVQIFIVSGNHDSPERLNFGSRIMEKNGVHIAGTFDGLLKQITLTDEFGPVNIFLLPFIKPAMVQPYFADQELGSYEDAVRVVINASRVNTEERNILVAHQFITSNGKEPERSESETVAVGGLDNIDASVFKPFDYVALGHLHGPQSIGRETVRYAGSPLKYSFSEVRQHKSVTILEFAQKGTLDIQFLSLTPRRDMREIKGPLAELVRAGLSTGDSAGIPAAVSSESLCQDYIRAVLTDEDEVYDAIGQLRQVYPSVMRIDFENSRSRQGGDSKSAASGDVARKSPMELFEEFYIKQNNTEMTEEQRQIMQEVLEQAGGADR